MGRGGDESGNGMAVAGCQLGRQRPGPLLLSMHRGKGLLWEGKPELLLLPMCRHIAPGVRPRLEAQTQGLGFGTKDSGLELFQKELYIVIVHVVTLTLNSEASDSLQTHS